MGDDHYYSVRAIESSAESPLQPDVLDLLAFEVELGLRFGDSAGKPQLIYRSDGQQEVYIHDQHNCPILHFATLEGSSAEPVERQLKPVAELFNIQLVKIDAPVFA